MPLMNLKKNDTNTTSFKDLSDEEVVRQILLTKDRKLQEVLYGRYVERIFYKCFHIVRDKDVAQDLTHDVMIKVFTKLSKYKKKSPFYGWIFAITYNHCMDYLKAQKKLKITSYEDQRIDVPEADELEREHMALKEVRLNQLEKLLKLLNHSERLVLLMRYQDGMSIKQMAGVLNISESAVKMRLKRGRDRLAGLLKNVAHDDEQ